MEPQLTFERRELKYVLDDGQRQRLEWACAAHMVRDEHGATTVRSVYLDTPSLQIARSCAEHPSYREKIRLRAYGEPSPDKLVFLELKKKVEGVVYKRRVCRTRADAQALMGGTRGPRDQMERELVAAMGRYEGLVPQVFLAYDRDAFYEAGNRDLRMTYDRRVRARWDNPELDEVSNTRQLLADGLSILEVKTSRAIPSWLALALEDVGARQGSWSKYGTACRARLTRTNTLGLAR